jgi:tetratricopeptide (TPR) repeat protein
MEGFSHRRISLRRGVCLLALAIAALSGCRAVSTGRNVDGVRYFQQGQYPVAIQRFDAALTIDPRNPDSYYNKGAVLHRTGLASKDQNSLNQAESLYRQCLAYNPDHVDCHRGLAVLLTETNRVPEAFTLLRNWATLSPQNSDARVELARLYEEYGDPRSAEVYLAEALAINTRDWRAHAALGRLKEQSGDLGQALVNYERAQQLNRYQPQLEQRIASLRAKAPAAPIVPGTTPGTTTPPISATRSAAAPQPFRTF